MPNASPLDRVRKGATSGILAVAFVFLAAGCSHHPRHPQSAPHPIAQKTKIRVNVWLDPETGKIASCKLLNPTGDREIDSEIETAVLTSLQLPPLPPGLPMPIMLRLIAQQLDESAPLRRFTIASQ